MAATRNRFNVHARVKLHAWMDSREMTQQELARRLGVNRMTIGRWLRGEHPPSFDMMKALQRETKGFVSANDWMVEGAIQAVA